MSEKLLLTTKPELRAEWDDELGDRQTKLCFIGRHMNHEVKPVWMHALLSMF